MFPTEKEYGKMTKRISPPSTKVKDFIFGLRGGRLNMRNRSAF